MEVIWRRLAAVCASFVTREAGAGIALASGYPFCVGTCELSSPAEEEGLADEACRCELVDVVNPEHGKEAPWVP